MGKKWMAMLLCIGMLACGGLSAAASELTISDLRLPYTYTITDNTVDGLGDDPLMFLAGLSYSFSVTEAGAGNVDPIIGDEKYLYRYWSLTEKPTLAQVHKEKEIVSTTEIVSWGVYTLYVWFQKFTYGHSGWEKSGSPEAVKLTIRSRDPYADDLTGTRFEKGRLLYTVISSDKAVCKKVRERKRVETVPAEVKYEGRFFRVVRIGEKAFMNDKKLRKITIGSNVAGIGANAFRSCKKLRKVVILSEEIVGIGEKAFKGTSPDLVVVVPSDRLTKYRKLLKKAGFKGTVVSDLVR